tara:strand:- start:190 stop:363 length:174 start_codon:yes stop_codon:yes gene_type:complete
MYTTLDPKNKLSMIFIGLALTTILFATLSLIAVTKSGIQNVFNMLEQEEDCNCEEDS